MKKHRANVFLALGAAVMLAGCGSGKGEGTQLRMACFPNVTHAQALVMKNQNILEKATSMMIFNLIEKWHVT